MLGFGVYHLLDGVGYHVTNNDTLYGAVTKNVMKTPLLWHIIRDGYIIE